VPTVNLQVECATSTLTNQVNFRKTPRGAGPIPVRLRQLLPRRVHGHSAQLPITLPAVSVPSLIMVRRVFPAKVLAATVGAVIALGLLTAGTAALIGL